MSGRPTRLPSPQKRELKTTYHNQDDVNKQPLRPLGAAKQAFPPPSRNILTQSATSHGDESLSNAQGAMSEYRRGRTLARQAPFATTTEQTEHVNVEHMQTNDPPNREDGLTKAAKELGKSIQEPLAPANYGQAAVTHAKMQQTDISSKRISQTAPLPQQAPPVQAQTSQTAIATTNKINNASTRSALREARGPPSSFKQPVGSVAPRTAIRNSHNRHSSLDASHTPTDPPQQPSTSSSVVPSTRLKRASSTSSKKVDQVLVTATAPTSSTGKRAPTPTSTDNKRPPSASRPTFSTYQQSYTPLKRTSSKSRAAVTVSKPGPNIASSVKAPSSSSALAIELTPTATTALPYLRIQTHLLHLSLMHRSSHSDLASYIASARTQLESRFNALVELYTTLLTLSRSTRQYANLLALHQWSGGNDMSLSRKLNVLVAVLAEVCTLTDLGAGKDHSSELVDEGNREPQVEDQIGRYAQLVSNFEQWMAWVKTVWAMRDASAAAATETSLLKEQEKNGSALYDSDSEIESEQAELPRSRNNVRTVDHSSAVSLSGHQKTNPDGQEYKFTQIEGLGDAQKTEMKSLAALLDKLFVRMQDIATPPIPDMLSSAPTAMNGDKIFTTPACLLAQTTRLVNGMREELQMMKEIEFEVVIGEKAWMDEGVRDIAIELAGK